MVMEAMGIGRMVFFKKLFVTILLFSTILLSTIAVSATPVLMEWSNSDSLKLMENLHSVFGLNTSLYTISSIDIEYWDQVKDSGMYTIELKRYNNITLDVRVIVDENKYMRSIKIAGYVIESDIDPSYKYSIALLKKNEDYELSVDALNTIVDLGKRVAKEVEHSSVELDRLTELNTRIDKSITLKHMGGSKYISYTRLSNNIVLYINLDYREDHVSIHVEFIKDIKLVYNTSYQHRLLSLNIKRIDNNKFILYSISYEPYNIVINNIEKMDNPLKYKGLVIDSTSKWLKERGYSCDIEELEFIGAYKYSDVVINKTHKLVNIEYFYRVVDKCGHEIQVSLDPAVNSVVDIESTGVYSDTQTSTPSGIGGIETLLIVVVVIAVVLLCTVIYLKKH